MSDNKKSPPFPSKEELRKFLEGFDKPPGKREVFRAFQLRNEDEAKLNTLLKQLRREMPRAEGARDPDRGRGRKSKDRNENRSGSPSHKGRDKNHGRTHLPSTTVLEIHELNEDGEMLARPVEVDANRVPPLIIVTRHNGPAPTLGDRILAQLHRLDKYSFEAHALRILPKAAPLRLVGVVKEQRGMRFLDSVNRKDKWQHAIAPGSIEAETGDLVEAELVSGQQGRLRASSAKIMLRIGKINSPATCSLIAIAQHNIPTEFSAHAREQAEETAAQSIVADGREDLRTFDLVTIDGEDARDFDDAVWAEADTDPANPGGWHLLVAIADVAHYVHPFDALDKDAYDRGNSVYFPDRVVPMLPEALSNGACSLRPDGDRYCLAVHIWIDKDGNEKKYKFVRGIMRSKARLTYNIVQAAYNAKDAQLMPILEPLYGAFASLSRNRSLRGSLDLDLPEYKIILNDKGHVGEVTTRERLDSHRLIEEFMIAANVAAADVVINHGLHGMFRVHEPPPVEKVDDLRQFLEKLGYALSKGDGVQPGHFNRILHKSAETPHAPIVHTAILRTQTQAYYSPKNMGHFGLALTHYAHFTSPIRRYSDLLLHRALINFLFPKEQRVDGMSREQAQQLPTMAEHISTTERRAMLAERDANERYIVHYMADHVGWTGEGVTTGVNSYGLFVTLPQTGATGFVPVSTLSDFFRYDEKLRMLMGARSGQRYGIGQKMVVRLKEANTMTGSLLMELLSAEPLPFEDILPSNSARDKRRRDEHKRGNRRYGPKDDKHGGGKKGKHKHGGNQRFKKK